MNFIRTLLFISLSILITKNLIAFENKILFKVDNELITSIDIFNQSRYLTTLNSDLKSLNNEEIFELSKNIIIKEKIKKIKLEKSNINLNLAEKNLNSYINAFYSKQGIYNLNDYKLFQLLSSADTILLLIDPYVGNWNTTFNIAKLSKSLIVATSKDKRGYYKKENIYYLNEINLQKIKDAIKKYSGKKNNFKMKINSWKNVYNDHHKFYSS